ncbi:MAG: ribosome maturation factor RimP [Gammaproteobacteria bacterium HGW-Gammaproteobacteria-7]|nr:MAG: ribosome maturation factor RimP [Gammaproteobacteria bacterium HGW-Gammaproteobacteria-7]
MAAACGRDQGELPVAKAEKIVEMLSPVVAALDLELLGVEYQPSGHSALLRLYIDAPGRLVAIEDCERVSREVSAILDVNDPITSQYTLEVSSPGIDRPLFTVEQVARHIGEQAKFNLGLPMQGRRRLQGLIRAVEDGTVILEVEGETWNLPFADVDRARLVPDLAALGLVPGKPEPEPGKPRRKPGGGKRTNH